MMKISEIFDWGSLVAYCLSIASAVFGKYDLAIYQMLMALYLKMLSEEFERRGE